MAFYKSKYTGIEIDQRLAQATYDDAVLAGFEGSKEEFDAILGKLKEIADKAENSIQMESENLDTFNKNVVDAINELHRELQAKPDERDVIDQGELEVFKDEIAAKYVTKEEIKENINDCLTDVNQVIQQNAETIIAEINQRKEADTELDSKITQEISDRQTADSQLLERIETLENAGYQNADQVKAEIEKLVDAAPEALDTLKEIGDALNNDPDFATTVTNELSKKADKTELDKYALKTDVPEAYDDTQLRNKLQQTETGVATANSEIEKLKSGKQSIQDETLQTADKTIVGAINELLVKVQELETKNTELESKLAALEAIN